jgi:outer membrane protein assembly factor BamB
MNRVIYVSFLLLFLVGCSSKEPLLGTREELIVAEANESISTESDTTPVIIDTDVENSEYPQQFLKASHCYAPLKFSISPKKIWSEKIDFEVSDAIKTTAAPIIAEGKVFCADAAGIIYAFDHRSGKKLWRTSTTIVGKDGQIGCAMAYDSGRIIVSSSFSECFSLDSQNGKVQWRIKLPAACKGDGITIQNGKALVMCSNSSLHAIDIRNGKTLWSHSGMIADATYIGSASVAVDDEAIYLAYPSGEVFALLIENGAVIWEAMMSKFSLVNASLALFHPRACPVVKDGVVYVVTANGQTSAFNTKTGKQIWKSDFGGIQTPIVSGNSIFLFNSKSEIVCLNKSTGRKRWSQRLTSDTEQISDWYGMLLINDHLLMISPKGQMIFVSIYDGKVKKIIEIDDGDKGISVNPSIANSIAYILLDCGKIAAYK